jgi:hypothetical protein
MEVWSRLGQTIKSGIAIGLPPQPRNALEVDTLVFGTLTGAMPAENTASRLEAWQKNFAQVCLCSEMMPIRGDPAHGEREAESTLAAIRFTYWIDSYGTPVVLSQSEASSPRT